MSKSFAYAVGRQLYEHRALAPRRLLSAPVYERVRAALIFGCDTADVLAV